MNRYFFFNLYGRLYQYAARSLPQRHQATLYRWHRALHRWYLGRHAPLPVRSAAPVVPDFNPSGRSMKFQDFLTEREIVHHGDAQHRPQVSVVMPTYCRMAEGLLTRCVDSMLAQTFTDFEFIIIDDGSVDGSEAVLRDYAARDPRIVYVRHHQNSGLPAVRTNEGILLARAPYISFIFDDNIWAPEALATLVQAMEQHAVDVVHGKAEMKQKNRPSFYLGEFPVSSELLQHINTIPNGAVLCRQSFFATYGLYDPHLILKRCCDWDLWWRAAKLGARFHYVDATISIEHGLVSEVSLGNSVQWDYKITYAYQSDAQRLPQRVQALRPEHIGDFDVADPERLLPYLRTWAEWEQLHEVTYQPFFARHPEFQQPSLVPHNRLWDEAHRGYALNHDQALFPPRRRIILVSNSYHATAQDLHEALAQDPNWIALSCSEWGLSAFQPHEVDAVILLDCCARFLYPVLDGFKQAGVPMLYLTVHGQDQAAANDPLPGLRFGQLPSVQTGLGCELYFPQPGYPWPPAFQVAAQELQTLASLHLRVHGPTEQHQQPTKPQLWPFQAQPLSLPQGLSPQLGFYLGQRSLLSASEQTQLQTWLQQHPLALVHALPEAESMATPLPGLQCSHQSLENWIRQHPGTLLWLPDPLWAGYSGQHRWALEELAAQHHVLLQPFSAWTEAHAQPEAHDQSYQQGLQAVAARGQHHHPQQRALQWRNLVQRLWLGSPADPQRTPNVLVLITSPLLAGSEMYGLQLAEQLHRLSMPVSIGLPTHHPYGADGQDGDVQQWLRQHGLPAAQWLPYGDGQLRPAFTAWLDQHQIDWVIATGHVPEALNLPAQPQRRLVFAGLFQPWAVPQTQRVPLRHRLHGVFTDCAWAAHIWRGWMAPPVAHAPTPVAPEHFHSLPRPAPSGRVRIALGGTVQPRKQQYEALQAAALLLAEGYDLELHLYGYRLEMLNDYVQRTQALGEQGVLAGRVHWHGLVPVADIAAHNHVFLSASRDESMPQTLLFMLAAGLVAVAAPAGGIEEVVRDQETGILAQGFDVPALALALRRALDQREAWPRWQHAAQQLLRQEYAEPQVTQRWLQALWQGSQIARHDTPPAPATATTEPSPSWWQRWFGRTAAQENA